MNYPYKLLLTSLLGMLYTLVFFAMGRAEPPKITIEVTPSTVQIASGEETDAVVIVRNTTRRTLKKLQLFSLSNAGLTVTIKSPEVQSLSPDGSHPWEIHIAKSSTAHPTSDVCFRLDYLWTAGNSSASIPGTATGMLSIQDRPLESIDKVAGLRTETVLDRLEEKRPGFIYLALRNLSNLPINVTSIVACKKPDCIELDMPLKGGSIRLAPQESKAFPIGVSAADAVQPGDHMLLFEVGVNWERLGRTYSGKLIATHKLKLGVMGESDILKLIGVPMFFLLPGFLMVSAYIFLRKHCPPYQPIQIELKSPEFWVLAITLSLITAPTYPVLTAWRSRPRNYMDAYGMLDVAWVWGGSVAAAIIFWAFVDGGKLYYLKRKKKLTARITPSAADGPLDVLDKLARTGIGLCPVPVDVQLDGHSDSERFFIIEPGVESKTDVWIAAPILYKWTTQPDEDFRARFMELLNKKDAALMAELIRKGCREDDRGKVMMGINWRGGQHPLKVDRDKLKERRDLGELPIIEEENEEW